MLFTALLSFLLSPTPVTMEVCAIPCGMISHVPALRTQLGKRVSTSGGVSSARVLPEPSARLCLEDLNVGGV